ncbi:MAG: hypothetical protein N2253_05345 [Bacteroidia bacterium]|nr:hypothetical protein [Bacteroidia bacterium]MCX7764298.1 hypothetical protein [Bacteroidia bacterium]MDW8057466.1 hypothetical protein [Bacteroidia bacterium]
MAYAEKLAALHDSYQRERRKVLHPEITEILLRTFPAILVAQADGFTDTTETQRLEEIVAFLCKEKNLPLHAYDWAAELRYLAVDADFWRSSFLETLKELLHEKPELYYQQAEFLYATAAASTGDVVRNLLLKLQRRDLLSNEEVELISDKERMEIERLIEALDFAAAPEALAYLRNLLIRSHA